MPTDSVLRISPLILPGFGTSSSSTSSSSSPVMSSTSSSPVNSAHQSMNGITIAVEARDEFATIKTTPSLFSYKIPHYKYYVNKTDEVRF
jgi:hypothetical protein